MKVVDYTRISEVDNYKSVEDRKKKIDDQKEINKLFIERHNQNKDVDKWKHIQTFDEGYAKSTDRGRKVFESMRQLCRENKIDIIIVKKQSRLARDIAFLLDFLKDIEAMGIKVYESTSGRLIKHDDPLTQFNAIMDAQQITTGISEQALMVARKKRDKMPFGRCPLGYSIDKNEESKTYKNWLVNKDSHIIKKIFRLYLKYENIKKVAKKVNMDEKKVWRILNNKKYTGVFCYEHKYKDSNKKVLRSDVIEYEASYKAIIEKKVFIKVKDILRR